MLILYLALAEGEENRKKIETVYIRYRKYMCYSAKRVLQNDTYIDDIVHDSIISIARIIESVDVDDHIKTVNLCITVAKNKAIDFLRLKENQNLPLEEDHFKNKIEFDLPEFAVIQKETLSRIEKAIESLDEKYKDVCRLKYISDLKEAEIAALLELPPKTVNMRIFRGKIKLREALRKEGLNV